ncbi:hypothetical protein GCM10010981_24150 [Dyella nitratireducens]|uniref:Uncharacterized protein n=1 Tax=Dyella nitratireducens TaxID=1849580 RepID=A0ABQ1FZ57_9GAMM|nr:hypothetical protein GCM10010981_24150 [Dyella nitratireducens]GLQ40849.1 hypothetical protein GCM10007902_06990 [Dyella nitratireducens]
MDRGRNVGWGANPEISPRFLRCPSGKVGVRVNVVSERTVIPAKAGTRGEHMDVLGFEERGIHASHWRWIPAFAGMTAGFETNFM